MKIYLVGGAIRDKLLKLKIKDKDFVIVGSSEKELLDKGYKQIGKYFPVFINPKDRDNSQYSLARSERKIAPGYRGFEVSTNNNISLKDDLKRRDITINAIAQNLETNEIIDYFNGEKDLKNRIIRHVSQAFNEDPTRILRVARFATQLADFNFKVANDTIKLMADMVDNKEIESLVAERIWQETESALKYKKVSIFFLTLNKCNALSYIFFPIAKLLQQNKNLIYIADNNNLLPEQKWALLLANVKTVEVYDICKKLKCPKVFEKLAIIASRYYKFCQQFQKQSPDNIIIFLNYCGALRNHTLFTKIIQIFKQLNVDIEIIKNISDKIRSINFKDMKQSEIKKNILNVKKQIITNALKNYKKY